MANRRLLTILSVAVLSLAVMLPAIATSHGDDGKTRARHLVATLRASAEVPPVEGVLDAGLINVYVDIPQNLVCYELISEQTASLVGEGTVTGLHIHDGRAGENGPVVVTLFPNATAVGQDGHHMCISTADPDEVRKIGKAPGRYYVNLHTADNPAGELRGQLNFARGR